MKQQYSLVIMFGRLAKKPVTKNPKKASSPVTECRLAVNEPGNSKPMFMDFSIFGVNYAELLKSASKGIEVMVIGRLRQKQWVDDLAVKRSSYDVLASHVSLVPDAPVIDVAVDDLADGELKLEAVDEAMAE